MSYKLSQMEYCIECVPSPLIKPSFLHDREEYDEKKILTYYFNMSHKVFLNRLSRFKELTRQINQEEQKELLDMLGTLIDTQRLIYGIKDEKNDGKANLS